MKVNVRKAYWNLKAWSYVYNRLLHRHSVHLELTTRSGSEVVNIWGNGNRWFYGADDIRVGQPFPLSRVVVRAINNAWRLSVKGDWNDVAWL